MSGNNTGGMRRRWISLYVENRVGVLARISGSFSGKAYNIHSLTVGETEDTNISRMTVCVDADDSTHEQIKKQLNKLEDVVEITELEDGTSVCRELVLVKVKADIAERQQIIAVANVFRASIVDVSPESLMIELTGNTSKIEAFINLLNGFTIQEFVRTGLTGLVRGN